MNNNDIFRRIRFTFDFSDAKMIELFKMVGAEVSRTQVCDWLKNEEDPEFRSLHDIHLAAFLNGFIIDQRGKKEGGMPKPEKTLSNNIIFRKLKIALNLRDEDILEMLELANFKISRHELSAFFRKPDQNQYRLCKDQILRNFLQGMQLKYRDGIKAE